MIVDNLDLEYIAAKLEALEETIIAKLIDRAQFLANVVIYEKGKSGFSGDNTHSLFEIRLIQQECLDARFGRFCAPEERPFIQKIPGPRRIVHIPKTGLQIPDYNVICQSDAILKTYLELIPRICDDGDELDDGQYGSSVELDVFAVHAIARRVHFGSLYVAESKFIADPEGYTTLIKENDTAGIMNKLTRIEVEKKIINRIRNKTASVQQHVNHLIRNVIDPDIIAAFYETCIIPLTKKGQLAYLLNRTPESK
jgi:chorismate mutase